MTQSEIHYSLVIDNPEAHYVKLEIKAKKGKEDKLHFYLPVWSPGSYLIREYGRHLRSVHALSSTGERLHLTQVTKAEYCLDFNAKDFPKLKEGDSFTVHYDAYCHEISVRTSFVDPTHAFLHGPTLFMGIKEREIINPTLKIKFPEIWSKISTGLKDISPSREEFVFTAPNYDLLLDTPIEIGCHETDGFHVLGKDHELAFYGDLPPHEHNLKKDMETIVKHIGETFGGLPYEEKYTFITHFIPGVYGGLEHSNSTALHFDPYGMIDRKGYLGWLELVSHEYFHTWNVKRIRPKELGPFDYLNEAYTKMHWLTEGLTSFMDMLFVYRAGLMTIEEYAEGLKDTLIRYYQIPGRKFHSLEESSFNAWIKLYRPDENSNNSSISYYLKGGLVFMALHIELQEAGKSINDLLKKLWDRYLANPKVGVVREEVIAMIAEIAGPKHKDIVERFEARIETTEEIDFSGLLAKVGLKCEFEEPKTAYLGAKWRFEGDRVFVESVTLDSPAMKEDELSFCAGDEVLFFEGMRFLKKNADEMNKFLRVNERYQFMVSRLGRMQAVSVLSTSAPKNLKAITVADKALAAKVFG